VRQSSKLASRVAWSTDVICPALNRHIYEFDSRVDFDPKMKTDEVVMLFKKVEIKDEKPLAHFRIRLRTNDPCSEYRYELDSRIVVDLASIMVVHEEFIRRKIKKGKLDVNEKSFVSKELDYSLKYKMSTVASSP
jgi:hypothetical protein